MSIVVGSTNNPKQSQAVNQRPFSLFAFVGVPIVFAALFAFYSDSQQVLDIVVIGALTWVFFWFWRLASPAIENKIFRKKTTENQSSNIGQALGHWWKGLSLWRLLTASIFAAAFFSLVIQGAPTANPIFITLAISCLAIAINIVTRQFEFVFLVTFIAAYTSYQTTQFETFLIEPAADFQVIVVDESGARIKDVSLVTIDKATGRQPYCGPLGWSLEDRITDQEGKLSCRRAKEWHICENWLLFWAVTIGDHRIPEYDLQFKHRDYRLKTIPLNDFLGPEYMIAKKNHFNSKVEQPDFSVKRTIVLTKKQTSPDNR